jgi:hypothetical protein
MSRSVDLFIASDEPIDAVAAHIAERTSLDVVTPGGDGGRYQLSGEGFDAVLHRHEYLDDDGLPLRRYAYALSMQTQATGHLGTTPEVTLLRRVSAALDDRPVLLVLDLQNRDGDGPKPAEPPAPLPPPPSTPPPVSEPAASPREGQ